MRLRLVSAALVGSALLIGGCGGDDESSEGGGASQAEPHGARVTITTDRTPPNAFIHGSVFSPAKECQVGRSIEVFKQEPGADRLLATLQSTEGEDSGVWGRYFREAKAGWRVYAQMKRITASDEVDCLPARSPTHTVTGAG